MWYQDIQLDEYKYRAVYFTSYRPNSIFDLSSKDNTYQDDNGYYISNVYFFRYDPIVWKVLKLDIDSNKAFLFANLALDAQEFNSSNTSKIINGNTVYANNYEYSTIRTWLNDNFYNTAFTKEEQSIILETLVNNDLSSTNDSSNPYICNNTIDKVFLLSENDVLNSEYGFGNTYNEGKPQRQLYSTDYAKVQGCYKYNRAAYLEKCCWILRSPTSDYSTSVVQCVIEGDLVTQGTVYETSNGIVPALWIDLGDYARTIKYNLPETMIEEEWPNYYEVGVGLEELPVVTLKGYNFLGWSLNGEYITSIDTKMNENIILDANWELSEYSVEFIVDPINFDFTVNNGELPNGAFMCNDEGIMKPELLTYYYGSKFELPSLQAIDYNFAGWFYVDNSEFKKIESIDVECACDYILYAFWFTPDGSIEKPYLVNDVDRFIELINDYNNVNKSGNYIKVTGDIDFSEKGIYNESIFRNLNANIFADTIENPDTELQEPYIKITGININLLDNAHGQYGLFESICGTISNFVFENNKILYVATEDNKSIEEVSCGILCSTNYGIIEKCYFVNNEISIKCQSNAIDQTAVVGTIVANNVGYIYNCKIEVTNLNIELDTQNDEKIISYCDTNVIVGGVCGINDEIGDITGVTVQNSNLEGCACYHESPVGMNDIICYVGIYTGGNFGTITNCIKENNTRNVTYTKYWLETIVLWGKESSIDSNPDTEIGN